MKRTQRTTFVVLAAAAVLGACETYVAPPKAEIRGVHEGILDDVRAPVEVTFSKPVDPATLAVKITPLDTDIEGMLPDEQTPARPLSILFQHDPGAASVDLGGESELDPGGTLLRIRHRGTFPSGRRLVLLLEPGLADLDGHRVEYRQKLAFGFPVRCADRAVTGFGSGKYFFVLDVERPIRVQIRLWGDIIVDPSTGRFIGQFTSGIRNRDPARCPVACAATEACRTLPDPPGPHCVIPSEKAGGVDEFPDYVPNAAPPTGFSFTVPGCVQDQDDGTVSFAIAPVDVAVEQPPVTIQALTLTAQFSKDASSVLRATGSVSGDDVVLGSSSSGSGSGNVAARSLIDAYWPSDAPTAPYGPDAADGGLR